MCQRKLPHSSYLLPTKLLLFLSALSLQCIHALQLIPLGRLSELSVLCSVSFPEQKSLSQHLELGVRTKVCFSLHDCWFRSRVHGRYLGTQYSQCALHKMSPWMGAGQWEGAPQPLGHTQCYLAFVPSSWGEGVLEMQTSYFSQKDTIAFNW